MGSKDGLGEGTVGGLTSPSRWLAGLLLPEGKDAAAPPVGGPWARPHRPVRGCPAGRRRQPRCRGAQSLLAGAGAAGLWALRKRPHHTPAPEVPLLGAQTPPYRRAQPGQPRAPGTGRLGVVGAPRARTELTPEGRAHPRTPLAGPAATSFILKAPLPLGSRPSARPGPRVEGGAVSTCFAPSPRASRPSPRSGPRWANTCRAGTRRAPFPASRAEPHESRPARSGGAR